MLARNHELYSRYTSMKARCYLSRSKDFPRYGAIGIGVCSEWRFDFWKFVEWAQSSGYRKELTIERKNSQKDYCPENCVWASHEKQANNRKGNRKITAFGESKGISEWTRDPRCSTKSREALWSRLTRQGLEPEVAITHPIQKRTDGGRRKRIVIS